jgi:hypothetical protein
MASTGKSSQIQWRKCGGLGHFAHDCASSHVMIVLEDGGFDSASDYDEDTLAPLASDEQCSAAPTEKDYEYMAAEHAEKYPSLVAHRVLSAEITKAVPDMGWPDLLSKLAVVVMMMIDNLVAPMISPR